MSQDLKDIKNLLAAKNGTSIGLRTNRFSVDLRLRLPGTDSQITEIFEYPAAAVSAPSTAIQSAVFEYQNIPLQIPIKRQNTNQLAVTFYTTEDLNIYSTLKYVVKVLGGEPVDQIQGSGDQTGFAPSVYNNTNFYNTTIRPNTMFIRFLGISSGPASPPVNYIGYSGVYPTQILPIEFNSTEENRIGTFTALFNYSFTTTKNQGSA